MLDAIKPLLESGLINEDVGAQLNEAWEQKLNEAKEQVRAELREEYAQRYEHDRNVMVEALDKMVTESLQSEIEEFQIEKKAMNEDRVQAHQKLRENAVKFNDFMVTKLAEEIKELRAERKMQVESQQKLEQFIVHALAREIKEFTQDKRAVVEAKVKLVAEGRKQLEALKSQFAEISAKKVNESVAKHLKGEMSQLKEDIKVLSYSLELAEQKEQKLNAELEEWKNRARQETEQSLSGNRQRFNLLEEELQLLTRKKNILLQDYNKQLDKLQENSKSRIDEIKKRQDAEMAEMDSEKKNRVKEFEQKETELNTEKEKNFKSKGVDSKLLKQVEQQIEKLQIEMRALEQFDSLINDYLKDKRELFDALPGLNEKKEQFVKSNSDLQEAIEEAKRKTNLEEMELNKQKDRKSAV